MIHTGWLIFEEGSDWTRHFLKKGWGHVFFLGRDKYNWFTFNPLHHQLDFQILPALIEKRMELMARDKYTKVIYVEYRSRRIGKKPFKGLGLINCVTLMKYIIGMNTQSITPYGFYKNLLKMKYKESYPINIIKIMEVR